MIQRIIALSALVGLLSLWWLNQRKSSADSPSKGDRPRDTSKKESGTSDPEALDPLDEFLHQYGLDQQKLLLLEKGYNTIDVILEMTDDEMADLGLERLVVKKIKIAQRKNAPAPALSDAGPPTAATSPPVLQLDEIRVEEPVEIPIAEDYSPVQPQHNWMCQNQYAAHEVFISYRVESDTVNATTLHGTLAVTPQGQTAIHPYLDAQCLCNGMDWEQGFINGLYKSSVIIVILSEAGLKRTFNAHIRPDNQLLEIQHALKLMRDAAATDHPIIVQPVLMWSTHKLGDQTVKMDYFPPIDKFPEYPPKHKSSPLFDGKPMTVRRTFRELFKLQALAAADTAALRHLAPTFRELATKTTKARAGGSAYHQGGLIVFTAGEAKKLKALLEPVDSTQDHHALEALYVQGTRQWLFDKVIAWTDQDDTDSVLWVNAVAGVGKSVAAAKLASFLRAKNQLVSALFLKYNDTRKSDPRAVLTTIAYGLCQWYAPIGRKLLDAGHTKDSLDKMNISDLFKVIIEEPLGALGDYKPTGSVMILVDALDECSPRDQLLSLLAGRFVELNKTRPWLKLLLTSRPEEDIRVAFKNVPTTTIEPSSEDNIADLKVYIHHRLRNEHASLPDPDQEQAIEIILRDPTKNKMENDQGPTESIGKDTSKTFVWINLILNTLGVYAKDGPVTLATIKDINDSATNVGQMYQKTFAKIHSQSSHPAELVTVISAIATAQSILTTEMIARVFFEELERDYALRIMHDSLRSLNLVLAPGANGSTDDGEVKFNHKSVADYLLGDASAGHPWHVSSSFHMVFAKGCLGVILSHEPVINICEIFDFHDKIPDLEDRVAAKITPSLRYSVAHWITHFVWCVDGVAESSPVWQSAEMVDVAAVLTRFVKTHVFFWLECGSLTHVVKPIIEQLTLLQATLSQIPKEVVDDTTKELVEDTYRFVRQFADPIIASAPQVYNSGYAFTPKETAIYKTYADRLEDKIPFLVVSGPAPTWDTCEMTITGHEDGVSAVAISPNGKWIVSGSWDDTIKVWDSTTGQVKHTLEGHTDSVESVAISLDGEQIVSSSDDNTIKVWDATTGQLKHTLEGHTDIVYAVAISPDGQWIASGSQDKTIKIWELATRQLKQTLDGHSDCVTSVAISPDGKWIASGSWDKTVKVWDAATGAVKNTLEGHTLLVMTVAISPDGNSIVSGSLDKSIKIWDATTGQVRHTLKGHTTKINAVNITPDGKSIVSASGGDDGDDTSIKFWDLLSGREHLTLVGHTRDVNSLDVSRDGKWIVSGSDDESIKIWSTSANQLKQLANEHTDVVNDVIVSPDKRFVMSGSCDNTIKIWDATTGRLKRTFEGHASWIYAVAFSLDSKWIVSGSNDKTIKVWDFATGEVRRTLEGHTDCVESVAISPDGEQIVSGSDDKTVKIWDVATGQLKFTLEGHTDYVYSVAISPDGKWIASGSEDTSVKVWDAATGQLKQTLQDSSMPVSQVTISPRGDSIKARNDDDDEFEWTLQNNQFVLSDSASSTSESPNDASSDSETAADTAVPGSSWDPYEIRSRWHSHDRHMVAVPNDLFDWDNTVTVSDLLVMVNRRPLVIVPIYLNTPQTRLAMAMFLANSPEADRQSRAAVMLARPDVAALAQEL